MIEDQQYLCDQNYDYPGFQLLQHKRIKQKYFHVMRNRIYSIPKKQKAQLNEYRADLQSFLIYFIYDQNVLLKKRQTMQKFERFFQRSMMMKKLQSIKSSHKLSIHSKQSLLNDRQFQEFSLELQNLIKEKAAVQTELDSIQSKLDEIEILFSKEKKYYKKSDRLLALAIAKRKSLIDQIAEEKLKHRDELIKLQTEPVLSNQLETELSKLRLEIETIKSQIQQKQDEKNSLTEEIKNLQNQINEEKIRFLDDTEIEPDQLLMRSIQQQISLQKAYIDQQNKLLKELAYQRLRHSEIIKQIQEAS